MNDYLSAGYSSPHPLTTTPASRASAAAANLDLRDAAPDAILAVVPHLLGFRPSNSLVIIGLGVHGRAVVTFRYDLPEPCDAALAADIARHADHVLCRERLTEAVLVGYGKAAPVLAVLSQAAGRMTGHGITVTGALRADGGRYWSAPDDDQPSGGPPEGSAYDPGWHPAVSAAGLAVQPDRETLARALDSPAVSAELIDRATTEAQLRLARLAELGEKAGDPDPALRVTRTGRSQVQRAIRCYRSGRAIADAGHRAWLAVLLADLAVRDDAWARMLPAHADAHRRLWTDVVRCAAAPYVPAPASLLAFVAWQQGNGALAAIAVERALAADAGYSMATLLAGAVGSGLPPEAARLPMTPAAVAASYTQRPARHFGGRAARQWPSRPARARSARIPAPRCAAERADPARA